MKSSDRHGSTSAQCVGTQQKTYWGCSTREAHLRCKGVKKSVGSTYCTSSSAARLIAHNLMILGSTTSITYKRDCMSTWATNQNYCIGTSLIRATALHLFATGQSFKIPGCLTQMRSSACLQNKCHG